MMIRTVSILTLVAASSTSSALPPNAPAGLRTGANHHTGDDGFVGQRGRAPRPDEEKLRMREHFVAVRARLAAGAPTRPELAARRQAILALFDAYIEHGTTPQNDHLRWRTPVFIDDKGTICAVGYLIEQTAGRPLAERIAASHRYSFLEQIAEDLPEVRAWVAESGLTLDELAQIQPGYQGPDVLLWGANRFADVDEEGKRIVPDGPYARDGITGAFVRGKMEGAWVRKTAEGVVVGRGELRRGAGTWTSLYPDGRTLAAGAYERNAPAGTWRFFHPSGNLAAEGRFARGQRVGRWRFFYDTAAATPIAIGRFGAGGGVEGAWRHFDATGALLATTTTDTPEPWTQGHVKEEPLFWNVGYVVDIVPGRDGIRHRIHDGSFEGGGDTVRLDVLEHAGDRVYLRGDAVFDADGMQLVDVGDGWRADDCGWSATRKKFARRGDVVALNGLLTTGAPAKCQPGKRLSPARAERVARLVASMAEVRAATPAFMTEVALGEIPAQDLPDFLAANMSLDITWPHVDGRFQAVYQTLPGYARDF
jgi:hypothetical protein